MINKYSSAYSTKFYGSIGELPKTTITTVDGELYEVIDENLDIENYTEISINASGSYKYDKNIIDVSHYDYLHVYHPNANVRD